MKLIHFEEIDSTNRYAKENAEILGDFTFISASFQSEGKGRFSRSWCSNRGENLLFSLLVKDEKLIECYKDISVATAYVIYLTIKEIDKENQYLFKWPNDLYVKDKKLTGILLSSCMKEDKIIAVIDGVGININQCIFPSFISDKTTSLKLLLRKDVDLEKFKLSLYQKMYSYFQKIKEGRKDHILFAKENNYLKDKMVDTFLQGVKKTVKVIDINDDCSLKIEHDGIIENVISSEMTIHNASE